MSKQSSPTEPFAYILIVENDKDLRESALHTIKVPNCAVDVARDEDEAVHKALQHRPQLIIVKLHERLDIDPQNPPTTSRASLICRRAHLSRAVQLVMHSDVAITIGSKAICHPLNYSPLSSHSEVGQTFSDPEEVILITPKFRDQAWRKEWYAYSGSQRGMDFLSDQLPYWLGWTPEPPFPKHFEPFLRRWKWGWIFSQTIYHKRMSETFLN